jgi:predicted site-specific integrase-resolvase
MVALAVEEQEVVAVFQEYYTLKDAAKILGMRWRTLGEQVRGGKVSAIKVASRWLLHVDEIERLLQKQISQ